MLLSLFFEQEARYQPRRRALRLRHLPRPQLCNASYTLALGPPLKRSLSRLWRFPVEVAFVDVEDTVLEKDSDYIGAL